ncbi:MAG TPA: hypothetical protein VNL16_10085 [Chloroflexota bacterium]|nr:hypothetical protein [Chloroflexota bacterium]
MRTIQKIQTTAFAGLCLLSVACGRSTPATIGSAAATATPIQAAAPTASRPVATNATPVPSPADRVTPAPIPPNLLVSPNPNTAPNQKSTTGAEQDAAAS